MERSSGRADGVNSGAAAEAASASGAATQTWAKASADAASGAPSFCIRTLGCKVNRAESEAIAAEFSCAGWRMAAEARGADIVVVNTCTVTGEADRKNRKLIRRMLDEGDCPVLVCGCAINIDAGFYADIDARVVCESDKALVVKRAGELLRAADADTADEGESDASKHPAPHAEIARQDEEGGRLSGNGSGGATAKERVRAIRELRGTGGLRTRADLKIQDGCDNACTFCIVHVARGPARSTPAAEVLARADELARAGAAEIVLVGIDIAAWHEDAHGEHRDLAWLVGQLLARTGVGRLRLSSIEPHNLSPHLVNAFAAHDGRLARHAHLCLQSGSDKVLHEMARRYSAQDFLDGVAGLRAAVPSIALSTDIIAGFPGESDEDFERTCELARRCAFMRLHVFRYSPRPGTPAAARADQVDPRVAAARAAKLQALGKELAARDAQARVGSTELVLVEKARRGTSESYHTVKLEADAPCGTLVPVRFTDVDEGEHALVGDVLL